MNLSKENQTLLALLGYALFGRELTIRAESVDWNQVAAEADRHAITVFLYPGAKRLVGVPEAVIHRTRNAAMLSAAKAEDMLHIQDEVVAYLQKSNIPCAVLKGFSVACCYLYPELRVPGDIDLLVGEEKLETAREWSCQEKFSLRMQGYKALELFSKFRAKRV